MKGKKIIIVLLVVAVAAGFVGFNVLNARQVEEAGGIPRNAPPVHWAYPSVQTIISSVSARGNVELRDRTIVFPETTAQILAVHVNVGDTVNPGDTLITYDDGILETLQDQLAEARLALRTAELGLEATRIAPSQTELLTAENAVEQARTATANAQSQLVQVDLQISQMEYSIQSAEETAADVETLFNSGVVARVEFDTALEAVRRLEDQLEILQSQRETAVLNISRSEEAEVLAVAQLDAVRNRNNQPQAVNQAQVQQVAIERALLAISQIERNIEDFERYEIAPVGGTVLNILVEEGEMSVSGRPLMEIADISNENLVIVVHVPENDAGGIALGQEVEISGGVIGNHRYDGYIELIHPLAAPRQMGTTVETVVTVEIAATSTERLRAGNTVDADIVTNINEDTIAVPLMATVKAGGGVYFVYVITDEGVLERRDITLGEFSQMYIEAFGLTEADRVVASPNASMYEGMQIRPLPPIN